MAQLKDFLAGLSCRYLGRTPRRAGPGPALLGARIHRRHRKHLQRCAACRARQQRERQYLERLRSAAVPAASEDLTARLLARTGEFPAGPAPDMPASPVSRQPAVPPSRTRHPPPAARTSPLRLALGIGGGAAAAAALAGGAAYLVGTGPGPALADASQPPAFSAAFPDRLSVPTLSAEGVSSSAWKLSSEPDVAPAGSLSAGELSALRAGGWTCPELRELGYHLVWARAGVAHGAEILELRLTDGQHLATVLEQHGDAGNDAPGPPATASPASTVPVNVLTGHPAPDDGFAAATPDPAGQDRAATADALWINKQAPFRAIYRGPAATFTYVSDLPAEQADDGVAALMRSRPAATPAAERGEGLRARLERGLQRMVELLGR